MRSAKLKIAREVTPEHGRSFAEEWIERSFDTGVIQDSVRELGLIEWDYYDPEIQGQIHDIEDEICEGVATQLTAAMEAVFMKFAPPILARERRRQSRVTRYLRRFPLRQQH